ncbi:hypothetical protein J4464_06095 [Candidatus Woesearchaeota archaeon]|nr:hypothetical protein [Candidatus Woesearchaeota archaeon]
MQIYYATTNAGKLASMQRDLAPYDAEVIQLALDIPEPRLADVGEISRHKALAALSQSPGPVVANDSGFYIHALGGFPKTYVNFALETIGIEGILRLMAGQRRACEFRESLAYMDSTRSEPVCFYDVVPGALADDKKGAMREGLWSKLALIFIPEGSEKTLAEMALEEYDAWRQLKRAQSTPVRQLGEWLARIHST